MLASRMKEPRTIREAGNKIGIDDDSLMELLEAKYSDPLKAPAYLSERLLKASKGGETHILCPMAGMHLAGEFIKGAVSILDPDVRVTLLITPDRDQDGTKADISLKENIKNSIRPQDRTFYVIDTHIQGVTFQRIKGHLPKKARVVAVSVENLGLHARQSPIKDKHVIGSFAAGKGDLLKYLMKHAAATVDDFKYGGFELVQALREDPQRYFTPTEIRRAGPGMTALGENEDSWPPVVEFIRTLPPARQEEIAAKLRAGESETPKALFLLGRAAAKDYLRNVLVEKIRLNPEKYFTQKEIGEEGIPQKIAVNRSLTPMKSLSYRRQRLIIAAFDGEDSRLGRLLCYDGFAAAKDHLAEAGRLGADGNPK